MGFDCGAEALLIETGGSSGWWYVRLTRSGSEERGGITCDRFGWTPSKYWKIIKKVNFFYEINLSISNTNYNNDTKSCIPYMLISILIHNKTYKNAYTFYIVC